MSYMHIENLYKNQSVLLFKRVYAMEKIHGTSAHIKWRADSIPGKLSFFSGGSPHMEFESLFDRTKLEEIFQADCPNKNTIIYGEAYGGKLQNMSKTYGPKLKFVAFEVNIEDKWLCVPDAYEFTTKFGLDFVHYKEVPAEVSTLDEERDAPSQQAIKNGILEPRNREGIVIRPLVEVTLNNGSRVIAKHKRAEFGETKTPRVVGADLEVLEEAKSIAEEWVTWMRLDHVIDSASLTLEMKSIPALLAAMKEDILRESAGEVVFSKEAEKAINVKTVGMFKEKVRGT